MAFTVQDYNDLVRLVAAHPELRRLVLSDELLTLPEIVRELAEAQRRHEERLAGVEERLARLEEAVAALTVQVQTLTRDVEALTGEVRELTRAQHRTEDRVGHMLGDLLELRYREHAAGYFSQWLRRVRVVPPETLEETLEAALSRQDVLDILRLDLLVSGRWLALPDTPEVWLAVEVAAVLNEADVARAWRRAELLRRAGYRTLPVVAGERITQDAEASARAQSVGVVQDGQGSLWDETLAAWEKGVGGRPT